MTATLINERKFVYYTYQFDLPAGNIGTMKSVTDAIPLSDLALSGYKIVGVSVADITSSANFSAMAMLDDEYVRLRAYRATSSEKTNQNVKIRVEYVPKGGVLKLPHFLLPVRQVAA